MPTRTTLPALSLITAFTIGLPAILAAQDAPVFARLAGEWRGEGTLMGRDARFAMAWRPHAGFVVLTFTNGFAAAGGGTTPVLSAVAVYRTSGGEAVWLDSRGTRSEIRWEATDSTLTAQWTGPTESGRTTYRVRSADVLEVVDEVRSGDAWRVFGTARYARAATAAGP